METLTAQNAEQSVTLNAGAESLASQQAKLAATRQREAESTARVQSLDAEATRLEPVSAQVDALRRERERLHQELKDLKAQVAGPVAVPAPTPTAKD